MVMLTDAADLHELDHEAFELALDILKEWRLDPYCPGKAALHDLAAQVKDM